MDDEEIRRPPTTHFVATVDDLTDMLDFDSKDIDGMDDDVGDEHEPAPIGHWKATPTHDVYMVDTPKKKTQEATQPAEHLKTTTHPNTGAPHTHYVSPTRYWIMDFQQDSNP